jgi:hypothetical protein
MESKRKQDLAFGLKKETEIIDKIKNYWQNEVNIVNTKEIYNEYCVYDFESESGTSWEVKSRRVNKTQYYTTILPVHKVRNTDRDQFFVFNFLNKCCYIKYDKDMFDTFDITDIVCYRDGRREVAPHYHIPVYKLTDMY